MKCIKDEEKKVLVIDRDIKERWRSYFHKFFSWGIDNKNRRERFNYPKRISKLFLLSMNLGSWSKGRWTIRRLWVLTTYLLRYKSAWEEKNIFWLTNLFNEILRSKRISDEWDKSTLILITKIKKIFKIMKIIEESNLWVILWNFRKEWSSID